VLCNYRSRKQMSVATMRTELLRFNGAVERGPAIDAWMKEHASGLRAIARQWLR
jgi:hypothetical protein